LITACAGVTHVVSTGQDTYIITSDGAMNSTSGGSQEASALEKAKIYCGTHGMQMLPIRAKDTLESSGRLAPGDVEFRCVDADTTAH